MEAHDNVVSVQANLLRERQVKASLRSRPEPKSGRRPFLDHHHDAGACRAFDVEAAVIAFDG
ncbi:MAG: hypothetical protein GEV05_08450 [Betaproteobacteria bacterium]|nr:hypothetical protein [Betaproteobacteria bacterium]